MRRSWWAVLIAFALVGAASAEGEKGGKPGDAEARETSEAKPEAKDEGKAEAPGGEKGAPLGAAGPDTVEAPPRPQREAKDFAPIPDRWRIEFPEWNRINPQF